jgi:hypothetical protein
MSLESGLIGNHKMHDEQEGPTYGDAFPPLPVASEGAGVAPIRWASAKVRPSVVTQVFNVPVEERKYNEMGDFGGQQAKICKDIADKTGLFEVLLF